MKKKGLFLATVAALGMLTVSVLAVSRTNKSSEMNFGAPVVHEKLDPIAQGAALAGNAFYVNLQDVSGWWSGDNAETWVYFYNDNNQHEWVQVTQEVPNDSNVFEITVPSGYDEGHAWHKAIVCRSSGGAGDAEWTNIWNKSGDMDINNTGTNGVRMGDGDVGDKGQKEASTFSYTAETRILKWAAQGTNQWTNSGLCVQNGSTNEEALATSWGDSETNYATIAGADVKAYFSNLVGVEDGSIAEQLAYRYDHILSAHANLNLNNFAVR